MSTVDQYSQTVIATGCWAQNVSYSPGEGGLPGQVTINSLATGSVTLSGVVAHAGDSVSATFNINGVGTFPLTLTAVCDLSGAAVMTDGSSYYVFASAALVAGGTYATVQGFGQFSAPLGAPGCMAAGTCIETKRGEVAVEQLRIGDLVRIRSGRFLPVIWLGRQVVRCRHYAPPDVVWPVRVEPDAFGAGRPRRQLFLSPDHAVWVRGTLVPIRYLVNDCTICPEPRDEVVYYHVELPTHEVLIAGGLPVESYLDTGNRYHFIGQAAARGSVEAFSGSDTSAAWQTRGCAPLVSDPEILMGIRAHLLKRAFRLGYRRTKNAALSVAVGDRLLPSHWDGTTAVVAIPPGAAEVTLRSNTAVPSRQSGDSNDHRRLGVAVVSLQFEGRAVPLDDPTLSRGWHQIESGLRWTDGAAQIRVSPSLRGRPLQVTTAPMLEYWTRT